jgi:hypothetical protein
MVDLQCLNQPSEYFYYIRKESKIIDWIERLDVRDSTGYRTSHEIRRKRAAQWVFVHCEKNL